MTYLAFVNGSKLTHLIATTLITDVKSALARFTCFVHQRPVLGPLLILFCVNKTDKAVS